MRLLFVIDSLGSGGAQRQLTTLALEMSRRGHRVDVFVYAAADHFYESLRAAGVTVHRRIKPWRYSWSPARELRRLYRSERFDAVTSFLIVPSVYAVAAGIGLRERPAIIASHRFSAEKTVTGIKQRIADTFFRHADHVTMNSHHLREFFEQRPGWRGEHITTIWNGLDLERFTFSPLRRGAGEPLRLLAVGTPIPYKNWPCIVEAISGLRREHRVDVHVAMAGRLDGLPRVEAETLAALRELIRERGVEDLWTFLGRRSDMAEVFAAHHALVHPSLMEGLPNAVCEALACGRPVLVSDVLDHPRLVQEGVTGFRFDPGDPRRLAEAILKLNAMPGEQLAAMGRAARAFAEEHLTVARLADEYEALFLRLAAQRGRLQPTPKQAAERLVP
jgi:glycosyltransferase involved in cell wall biosynthesis